MRKILILAVLAFLFGKSAFAQEKVREPKQIRLICAPSKFQRENPPLLIINNKYLVEVIEILNPSDIDVVIVKKTTDSLAKIYGEKVKSGIIEVSLKEDVQLLNLNELYNEFHIQTKNRNLPLYVNNKKILNKNQFVAASKWIDKAEIVNNNIDKTKDTKYINLKTAIHN